MCSTCKLHNCTNIFIYYKKSWKYNYSVVAKGSRVASYCSIIPDGLVSLTEGKYIHIKNGRLSVSIFGYKNTSNCKLHIKKPTFYLYVNIKRWI